MGTQQKTAISIGVSLFGGISSNSSDPSKSVMISMARLDEMPEINFVRAAKEQVIARGREADEISRFD
jgi:hypothetical protein